ncbi:hypothetical protein KY495_21255 [Massilia sp. PAMC28688]|nr:hypothetical protein [Massilia sp. PAMC28688]QYF96236.1 hypothetical protein KY495_21255 [Massilia sp. PAMC28688]
MNMSLGLRAVALLAFVAATTAVIIEPELIGGPQAATVRTLDPVVAISHP